MRGSRIRFVRSRRDVGGGRRTSSPREGVDPVTAVRQGLPRRRRQPGGLAAGPGDSRRRSERAPARARPGRVAIPRRPAAPHPADLGHPPAGCRTHAAGCSRPPWVHRRETGCVRRSCATSRRRAPRCASRSIDDGAPAVFAKHLADGTAPTSRPDTRHCGPRRIRHASSGSPNRWQPIRYEECCGPAGSRGAPWRRPCDPDQLPEATASLGAAAGGLARILRARHAGRRRR